MRALLPAPQERPPSDFRSPSLRAESLFSGRRPGLTTDSSFAVSVSLPASCVKPVYLLMIISNQNSENNIVNSPHKMRRLRQRNRYSAGVCSESLEDWAGGAVSCQCQAVRASAPPCPGGVPPAGWLAACTLMASASAG